MRLRTIGVLLGALLLGGLAPAAASAAGGLTLSAGRGSVEISEYAVSLVGVAAAGASGKTSVVVDASEVSKDVAVLHMLQNCARDGQVFTCETSLAAGAAAQFQLVVQARPGAAQGPAGHVRVSAPGADTVTVDLTVVRPRQADLQTASDRQVASVGQTVPVTVVVHNAGPDPAAGSAVTVSTADDLVFRGFASCPGKVSGRRCVLPELAAGTSVAVVVSVKVTGSHPAGAYGVALSTADPRRPDGGRLDVCVRGGYCTDGHRYGARAAAAPKPPASPQPAASAEPDGHPAASGLPLSARGPVEGLPAMLAFAFVFAVVVLASVRLARSSRPGRDG
ncbi:hypothetical protein Cs7R123_38590 [Catellatospora sp. TT07R-123]|uniref:DUF11 domain-containing protein n=1 Tax=Catellatospora sp. TT07R-123 TaxID=2733863 RepID=UPI001B1C11E9|nr:DUF11 domain-containing protein [Catellatospora sp. TT07R-123]GHJ46517.1 hypothetical protein Cs7R123_38590 [Catellatospora sp. TT07R-123]